LHEFKADASSEVSVEQINNGGEMNTVTNKLVIKTATWLQVTAMSLGSKVREERGDVPGWVLVTVMTAGLVVAVWSVADGQLKSVLTSALRSVSQP
jgi:hypothetical protein